MKCCDYIFQGTEKIQSIWEYIKQLSNIFNIVTALTYFLNFKKYWLWNLFNWLHNCSSFRSWYIFLEENFLRIKSIWLKYWFLPNSPGVIRDHSYVALPQELGAVFPGSLLNCFSHDKSINMLHEEELHCQWSYTLARSLSIILPKPRCHTSWSLMYKNSLQHGGTLIVLC